MGNKIVRTRFLSTFNGEGAASTTAPAAAPPAQVPPAAAEPTIPANVLPHLLQAQAEFARAEALRAQAGNAPLPVDEDEDEAPDYDALREQANSGDDESEDAAAQAIFERMQQLEDQVRQERTLRQQAELQALHVQAVQVARARGLDPAFDGYIVGSTAAELLGAIESALAQQQAFVARFQPPAAPPAAETNQGSADPAAQALAAQAAAAASQVPSISAPGAHAPASVPFTQPQPGPLDQLPQLTTMEAVRTGQYAQQRQALMQGIRQAAGSPAGQRWAFNPGGQAALPMTPFQGQTNAPMRAAPMTQNVAGVTMPFVGSAPPVTMPQQTAQVYPSLTPNRAPNPAQVQANPFALNQQAARDAAQAAIAAARTKQGQG